jgi:hypothetical protein
MSKLLFLFFGDCDGSAESLLSYLNQLSPQSAFLATSYDDLLLCEAAAAIIYAHDSAERARIKLIERRVIEFYIGPDESVDAITVLTNGDLPLLQHSINAFCYKCLQERRVLLVSPGGSACTAFLEFLNRQDGLIINTPNSFIKGGDGLKHARSDSYLVSAYQPTHVIYLYGDLDKTVRSLFRRGLVDISYFYDEPQKFMHPLMRKEKRIKFPTFDGYIDHVVRVGEEPLGIIKHWRSWVGKARFVHYETIAILEDIDTFIGLPVGTCKGFPIRSRESVRVEAERDSYIEIIQGLDKGQRLLP